jgi:hypothetical protein
MSYPAHPAQPGTEIASIHAGCADVTGVPGFFNFLPDLSSRRSGS